MTVATSGGVPRRPTTAPGAVRGAAMDSAARGRRSRDSPWPRSAAPRRPAGCSGRAGSRSRRRTGRRRPARARGPRASPAGRSVRRRARTVSRSAHRLRGRDRRARRDRASACSTRARSSADTATGGAAPASPQHRHQTGHRHASGRGREHPYPRRPPAHGRSQEDARARTGSPGTRRSGRRSARRATRAATCSADGHGRRRRGVGHRDAFAARAAHQRVDGVRPLRRRGGGTAAGRPDTQGDADHHDQRPPTTPSRRGPAPGARSWPTSLGPRQPVVEGGVGHGAVEVRHHGAAG